MARGRMINTTVAIDRRLNSLSLEAHLVFMMTVPHLDRDGLIAADPPLLAARVIPRRPELHPKISAYIDEWTNAGLALLYQTPDTDVLFFPGFRKNQTFQYCKEGASQLPPPPGYSRTASGLTQEGDGVTLDKVETNSSLTLELGLRKLNEVKRKEGKMENPQKSKPSPPPILPAYQTNGAGQRHAERMTALNSKLGPELRTALADQILKITGTYDLANTDGNSADAALYAAHEAAVQCYQMNKRTEQDLLAVEDDWYTTDFRGKRNERPTIAQFVEHASKTSALPRQSASSIAAEVYA